MMTTKIDLPHDDDGKLSAYAWPGNCSKRIESAYAEDEVTS